MEAILQKDRLGQWVAQLSTRARVFAPAFVDDVWGYGPVETGAEVPLDHGNTTRPPKNFVFPQREVLYRFRVQDRHAPQITPTVPEPEPAVVFGVRPCDGRAMVRNDKVFTCGVVDPYYQARRDKVVFVGLACSAPPSPNCFCQSVGGSPHSEDGLDVLMTELEGRYHVKTLTARGLELLDAARSLFDDAGAADAGEVERAHAAARAYPQRTLASQEQVVDGLKRNFDSPKWAELARACIGCGACTYLCPSCHCFDINDEITGTSPLAGERVRTWDNCQFPDFTMHSSGHNPRDDTGSRLRQRVAHKLLYFVENHGIQQCTGCGRCITHCPVGIDIVRVTHEVAEV
ncbi:MAG: 4Fe-4S dicluster domain-containing protein [Betaproteobacteria bacterium]|nr:4Fe-4S dicluster domain-containing protein [Betaproteobacteria bacterium]